MSPYVDLFCKNPDKKFPNAFYPMIHRVNLCPRTHMCPSDVILV